MEQLNQLCLSASDKRIADLALILSAGGIVVLSMIIFSINDSRLMTWQKRDNWGVCFFFSTVLWAIGWIINYCPSLPLWVIYVPVCASLITLLVNAIRDFIEKADFQYTMWKIWRKSDSLGYRKLILMILFAEERYNSRIVM